MLELEWYEGVRNGFIPLCDRCYDNINRDEFFAQRNQRGVYCQKCWTWIHLQRFECKNCGCKRTLRSETEQTLKCSCGEIMICLKK